MLPFPSLSLRASPALASLPLAARILLAAAAGGSTVLAYAPFSLFPLAFLSLALLYGLLYRATKREGFLIGWGFGIGLLGFGVYWIRISLDHYGNMGPALANVLTFSLVVAMAIYYGIAGYLTCGPNSGARWTGPVLAFPAAWVLTEWLRGWLFTGFPWLAIGYTQIDSPLAGFAPILGVYGVGLSVAVGAGLLWILVSYPGRYRHAAIAGLVLIALAGGLLHRIEWTSPRGDPLQATVVQGNIPQTLKWDPDGLVTTLRAYLELTRDNWTSDVIVWPETAVPDFLHQVREALIEPLAEDAREQGTEVVIGIPVLTSDTRQYFNGLLSIGRVEDIYLKRHLVPFGEFIPFRAWLGPLAEAFDVPMSDFSAGSAPRPLLQVGEYLVGASICFEDVFPTEVAEALPEAAYLINVSNDAWFGDSTAPHQHLEMARMRALENERWLVRSTNTGISAILDHRGRVVVTVPSFERGAATGEIQPRAGATPFASLGNTPTIGAAFAMLVMAAFLARTQRRQASSSEPGTRRLS